MYDICRIMYVRMIMYDCMHACIYMCVCVKHLNTCKLLPVDVDVHCFISTLSTLTDVLFPRTVASFQFDICSRGHRRPIELCPTKLSMVSLGP